MACSRSAMVFELSFLKFKSFFVTRYSTEVFKTRAIFTACSALGSLSFVIHDCNVL